MRGTAGRVSTLNRVNMSGDTETLPEGTEALVNMHTLRITEAGSVTLTAEEVQRATRDSAATPPPQALILLCTCMVVGRPLQFLILKKHASWTSCAMGINAGFCTEAALLHVPHVVTTQCHPR
jgi:hypothetical protein